MLKRMIPLLLLALILVLGVGAAGATPVDELTELAAYFPEDTPAFIAIRTDAGFFETLDGLLVTVGERLGEDMMDDLSVTDLLDEIIAEDFDGASFADDVRPWLGATTAIGFTDSDALMGMAETGEAMSDEGGLVAFSVADRDAAAAFLAAQFDGASDSMTEGDDYDLYESADAVALLARDVLLVGTTAATVEDAFAAETSLADNAAFTDLLASLPAESYDIVSYSDTSGLDSLFSDMMGEGMGDMGDVSGLMSAFGADSMGGPQVAGFTLVDGRSLVIDMVAAEGGLSLIDIPQNPIDLDFAAAIPAGAQFVIMDDGFGVEMQAGLEVLFTLLPLLTEVMDDMDGAGDTDVPPTDPTSPFGEGFALDEINAETVNLLFALMTGLDLNEDVLNWMTGDYAFFLRIGEGDDATAPELDLVFVTESDDPEAAANMITTLSTSSLFADSGVEVEEVAGAQALVLPLGDLSGDLFGEGMGDDMLDDAPEMDFLLAAGGDVFAAGTRTGVTYALDPVGASLLNDEAFQYAADNLFLADTVTVWFINAGSLAQMLPLLAEMDMDMGDMQDFLTFANLIESASITGRYTEDGTAITRLTVTLEDDEPVTLPEPAPGPEATEEAGGDA